jgi:hypothetical protein
MTVCPWQRQRVVVPGETLDFARIVDGPSPSELDAPTDGTRWTNRQLLFHMVLGQNIARSAIPLFGLFSHLPPSASRSWSRLLEACKGRGIVKTYGSAACHALLPAAALRTTPIFATVLAVVKSWGRIGGGRTPGVQRR